MASQPSPSPESPLPSGTQNRLSPVLLLQDGGTASIRGMQGSTAGHHENS